MKSKAFYRLFLAAITFVLSCTFSCNKPYQPVGITLHELPFSDYLFNHSHYNQQGGPTLITDKSDGSIEIGYSFTSTKNGIVEKLGAMMPDSGHVYTVSLWDSATQELMIQKNIEILNRHVFNYVDLIPTNEFQIILANHTYMIGIYTSPLASGIAPYGPFSDDFYNLINPNSGAILPFKGYLHAISFNKQYTGSSFNGPVFPKNEWPFHYLVQGFCDIGFRYVKPFPK